MRCFLAFELPPAVRDRLAELQSQLSGIDRLVRWTPPGQIHLTLKFLGEVPDDQVAAIGTAIQKLASQLLSFDLEVAGAGCFPPRGIPRVIWAGISGPPPELLECHRLCEQACAELGYPPENRAYHPHLTIGRTRDGAHAPPIRLALTGIESFSAGHATAHEIVLFESILEPKGARHISLARAPLGGLG